MSKHSRGGSRVKGDRGRSQWGCQLVNLTVAIDGRIVMMTLCLFSSLFDYHGSVANP